MPPFTHVERYIVYRAALWASMLPGQADGAHFFARTKSFLVGLRAFKTLANEPPYSEDSLLHDILSTDYRDLEVPENVRFEQTEGAEETYEQLLQMLREARQLLVDKAGPETADLYSRLVVEVARRNMNASGGGLLGMSEHLSEVEKALLAHITDVMAPGDSPEECA